MDLKQEFYQYKGLYDTFFDALNEKVKEIDIVKKDLIRKDKEDIAAQLDTKEKQALLDKYMLEIYKLSLIQNDMKSMSQKLLYIHEAALRNNVNLDLPEETAKFIHNLSQNETNIFVVANGKLELKNPDIEKVINIKSQEPTLRAMYIDAVRKDPDYANG